MTLNFKGLLAAALFVFAFLIAIAGYHWSLVLAAIVAMIIAAAIR